MVRAIICFIDKPTTVDNYICIAWSSHHYNDVIISMMASQITSLMIVYSIVSSGVDQRKHQSSASLAFVWAIHQGPVNSQHKWPVMRKMFPFDDVSSGFNIFIDREYVSWLMPICQTIDPKSSRYKIWKINRSKSDQCEQILWPCMSSI